MPIQPLPKNIYAGNAVRFDAMPYIKYRDQLQARQDAKDAALDQYFQKLPLGVNKAGLREIDNEDYNKLDNENANFWMANREAIKNPKIDHGKKQAEYYSRLDNQKLFIQNSKAREERKKPLVPKLADPKTRSLFTPGAIDAIHKNDLALNDPNGVPLDLTTELFNPTPHDQQKYFSGLKDIKMSEKVGFVPDPDNKLKSIATTTHYFDPKALNNIVQYAETEYNTKPGFHQYVNDKLSQPQEYHALNDVFKEHMGRDIDIQHPEELAIAYTLSGKQLQYETQKAADNKEAIMNKQAAIQRSNKIFEINHRVIKAGTGDNSGDNDLIGFYKDNYGTKVVNALGEQQEGTYIYAKDIDPKHMELITNNAVSPKTLPDGQKGFVVDQNGDLLANGDKRIDKLSVETRFAKWKTKAHQKDAIGNPKSGTTPSNTLNASEWKKKK